MHQVYLGIGGNTGDRKANMLKAISLIQDNIGEMKNCSSWYMSEAWGFSHNKYFVNAVIKVSTEKDCNSVLQECLNIEKQLLRTRLKSGEYEGRTIDIDILFYDDLVIETEKLIVPHPYLHKRNFVLEPLSEIAENFIHPIFNQTISELMHNCTDTGKIRKIVIYDNR